MAEDKKNTAAAAPSSISAEPRRASIWGDAPERDSRIESRPALQAVLGGRAEVPEDVKRLWTVWDAEGLTLCEVPGCGMCIRPKDGVCSGNPDHTPDPKPYEPQRGIRRTVELRDGGVVKGTNASAQPRQTPGSTQIRPPGAR